MAVSGVKGTGIGQVTMPSREDVEQMIRGNREGIGDIASSYLQGLFSGTGERANRFLPVPDFAPEPQTRIGQLLDVLGIAESAGKGGRIVSGLPVAVGGTIAESLGLPSEAGFESSMPNLINEEMARIQSEISPFQEEIRRQKSAAQAGVPTTPGLGTFTTAGGEEVRPGALMALADELGAMGPDGAPTDEGGKPVLDRSSEMDISSELGAMGPDGFTGAEETSKKETGGYDEVPTKGKESTNVAETGFSSGMKAYLDALTGADTGVKDLDEYKKEFAEATGINISGKPDKSSALMAFGLALMQNKAGKGFNVGRMLSSLGEAGEKAMPAFEKAKAAAKAEQLAAGKYALNARGAALTKAASARQAIADRIAALSDKAYDRDTQMQVQKLKGDQEITKQELIEQSSLLKAEVEAQAKAGELSEPKKINLGGSGDEAFDIQVQQRGKSGEFKIIAPQAAMSRIDKKIQSADAGLKTVNKMQDLSSGGQTVGYQGIYTRMSDAFKGLFSIPAVEEGSNVEQYRAAVGKMLVRYRKLLTGGEAGNAISDRDVAIIRQNLGLPEGATEVAFTSAAQVGEYLSSLEELFTDRKALFVGQKGALVEFGQSSGYYSEEAKDDDYSDDYMGYVPQVVGGKLRLTLPK
jgi:hypothetical protein